MRRMEGGDETTGPEMRRGTLTADGLRATTATISGTAPETAADAVAAVRSVNEPATQQLSPAAARMGALPAVQHPCSWEAIWPPWWVGGGKQGQIAGRLTIPATRAAMASSLRAILTAFRQCRSRARRVAGFHTLISTPIAQRMHVHVAAGARFSRYVVRP
jgi:hypothetical protein